MDSRLNSLFRTMPRHAESADTRLGIRRDEKQDQGRKKDDRTARDDSGGAPEDRMSVSVATLILFLENLLGVPSSPPPPAEAAAAAAAPPPLSPSAQAARAYQTADRGFEALPPAPPAAAGLSASASDAAIILSADDMRDIKNLIAELQRLAARRIDTLDIVWRGSFLQSVQDAMRGAGPA